MPVGVANMVLAVLGAYFFAGFLFGLLFISRGMVALDKDARGVPLGVRLLMLPGACALWPLLLVRWARTKGDSA